MGFCWQHVPVETKKERLSWRDVVDVGGTAIAAIEIAMKIAEIAATHLIPLGSSSGGGGGMGASRNAVLRRLKAPYDRNAQLPLYVDHVGQDADWGQLERIVQEAKRQQQPNARPDIELLERMMDTCFVMLSDSWTSTMFTAIERRSDETEIGE